MKKRLKRLEDLQVNNYYIISRNKKLNHIIKVTDKTDANVEWYEYNLYTKDEFKKMIISYKNNQTLMSHFVVEKIENLKLFKLLSCDQQVIDSFDRLERNGEYNG